MKRSLITCLAAMLPCIGLLAVDPSNRISDQLKGRRAELNALLEQYTEKHPLVAGKRMEIAALEKRLNANSRVSSTNSRISSQLQRAREDLNALLGQYTEKHPLVAGKRMEIAALEKTLNAKSRDPSKLEKTHEGPKSK